MGDVEMIWQIVKKQLLIIWRNPQQLLLLIGLPLILIAILGTALGSIMDGQSPEIRVKIAMIEHVDEEQQIAQFIKDLGKTGIPEEQIGIIKNAVSEITPITILRDNIFGNEDLKDMIEITNVHESEKEKILKDDSYAAVIEVPESFTYEMLEAMVLNHESQPQLLVYQNEGSQIGSGVVDSILTQYQEQFTLQTYLDQNGIDSNSISMDQDMLSGEMTSINQKESVSTKSYYGVGMAVMNVLFIASAISGVAFLEKKSHVFDRVILANVSRWVYFMGVFISGAILALLQLLIIFGFSWLLFGVSWPKVSTFLVVTVAMAISVGGISVLLTAISYRLNSEMISNFFSSILVTLMSFLGGSFFPIGDISKLIQMLGNFTPNGAGMSAYLSILRGDGLSEISGYVLFLILFAVVSIVIAALSFPKRGATA
jgi:ABC-2 type transport system permease protein